MEDQLNILQSFKTISLGEISDINDSLRLMKRQDTKFLLPIEKLERFIEQLIPHYRILEIENKRIFEYENLYFDTDALTCYRHHHNQKLNRYKFRHRKYMDSGLQYFEVKLKDNKRRTVKKRYEKDSVATKLSDGMITKIRNRFPSSHIVDLGLLKPKIWISFSRVTLASRELEERATIDFNLTFKNMTGVKKDLHTIAIAEIKQERLNLRSPFALALKELNSYPGTFSKYCTGIFLMENPRRSGRFKKRIIALNKQSTSRQTYRRRKICIS
ncbi:MAG: polyphosphate polymerase domain-containing protein [Deltaproteobacteria bacterium]|jgi:hypothetical protein|nr:polyphosphate polymerase domain-containing protein [Deltaproteobacteria bacterium]